MVRNSIATVECPVPTSFRPKLYRVLCVNRAGRTYTKYVTGVSREQAKASVRLMGHRAIATMECPAERR